MADELSAPRPGEAAPPAALLLPRERLDDLLRALRARGLEVIGPRVRGVEGAAAIVLDEIQAADELPIGRADLQDRGTYRVRHRGDEQVFGFQAGPHTWKQHLFVPVASLVKLRRREGSFEVVEPTSGAAPRRALLGARACDLAAMAVQDRVFVGGAVVDPDYAARRAAALVVAVQCTSAGATCFCASMGTGPRVPAGHDLCLTELLPGDPPAAIGQGQPDAGASPGHRFVVEIGSAAGAEVVSALGLAPASARDLAEAAAGVARAAAQMGRAVETAGLRDLLFRNLEHPRWDDVAGRCLSCANCTLVCPTCFCSTVEDTTDLTGDEAERTRRWDSCFTAGHSHVHGGSVRASTRARYRQWLTHKVGSWIDQFGVSGCVGCGRCITFCPAGIDLTEELAALRATDGQRDAAPRGHGGNPAAPSSPAPSSPAPSSPEPNSPAPSPPPSWEKG